VALCSNVGNHVDRDWAQAVADLQAIGELGRANGIRIAFEPICYGSWINTYAKGWEPAHDETTVMLVWCLMPLTSCCPRAHWSRSTGSPGHKIFF
jgi:hypothetical protein